MRIVLAVLAILAGAAVAKADGAERAVLERLVAENAAYADFALALQEEGDRLNAASAWFDAVAQSGVEWDEARMHAIATLRRSTPRVDRLETDAEALTFTAPDLPPLYGGVPRDRELALASVDFTRTQIGTLEASIEAARRRDAAALFDASQSLFGASREISLLHDEIVGEWLGKVPVEHPDYMLGQAMRELSRLWEREWPEQGAPLAEWLDHYEAGARTTVDVGRRIEALGRAAAAQAPTFEADLAGLLGSAGVVEPGILAGDTARAISRQAEATRELGEILQENGKLLERVAALDEDPGLLEEFARFEERYGALMLEITRHYHNRFRILSEGVRR